MKITRSYECPCGGTIVIESISTEPTYVDDDYEVSFAFHTCTKHEPPTEVEMCNMIVEQLHADEIKIVEQKLRQYGKWLSEDG